MGSIPVTCPVNVGGSIYDRADPVGRFLFNVLGMVAEFEPDLIRLRTLDAGFGHSGVDYFGFGMVPGVPSVCRG